MGVGGDGEPSQVARIVARPRGLVAVVARDVELAGLERGPKRLGVGLVARAQRPLRHEELDGDDAGGEPQLVDREPIVQGALLGFKGGIQGFRDLRRDSGIQGFRDSRRDSGRDSGIQGGIQGSRAGFRARLRGSEPGSVAQTAAAWLRAGVRGSDRGCLWLRARVRGSVAQGMRGWGTARTRHFQMTMWPPSSAESSHTPLACHRRWVTRCVCSCGRTASGSAGAFASSRPMR